MAQRYSSSTRSSVGGCLLAEESQELLVSQKGPNLATLGINVL